MEQKKKEERKEEKKETLIYREAPMWSLLPISNIL